MDGPTDYHTEWSESDKDKYHMVLLICGILKKKKVWYKWAYLQNRSTFADLENDIMVNGQGRGLDWKFGIDNYALLSI